MLFFLIYLALGIGLYVWVSFPRRFARFLANEWPSLDWTTEDTVMMVFLSVFFVALWPLTLVIIGFIAGVRHVGGFGLNKTMTDIHRQERAARVDKRQQSW